MPTSRLSALFLVFAFTSLDLAHGQGPAANVADSTWSAAVTDAIASAEYEFRLQPDEAQSWSAPNRRHDFRSRISERGVVVLPREVSADGFEAPWKLELSTTHFGRVEHMLALAPASVAARGSRVELDHGALTEWFENTPAGLEQGWTIATPPAGDAPLSIGLDFGGDLSLHIDDGARSGVLVDASGQVRLRYGKLLAFDASGRDLCARIVATSTGVAIEVEDAGALYPLTVDPILTGPPWEAFGNQVGAAFGTSVASAGDVNSD